MIVGGEPTARRGAAVVEDWSHRCETANSAYAEAPMEANTTDEVLGSLERLQSVCARLLAPCQRGRRTGLYYDARARLDRSASEFVHRQLRIPDDEEAGELAARAMDDAEWDPWCMVKLCGRECQPFCLARTYQADELEAQEALEKRLARRAKQVCRELLHGVAMHSGPPEVRSTRLVGDTLAHDEGTEQSRQIERNTRSSYCGCRPGHNRDKAGVAGATWGGGLARHRRGGCSGLAGLAATAD